MVRKVFLRGPPRDLARRRSLSIALGLLLVGSCSDVGQQPTSADYYRVALERASAAFLPAEAQVLESVVINQPVLNLGALGDDESLSDNFTAVEREAVRQGLAPLVRRVTFIENTGEVVDLNDQDFSVRDGGLLVQVGALEQSEDGVTVGIYLHIDRGSNFLRYYFFEGNRVPLTPTEVQITAVP